VTIPFNIPCSLGNEPALVQEAIDNGHISGNGPFTQKVHRIFEKILPAPRVLMTHSCTGALEMAAMLCDFQPGDEVIMPSFTHVGTANAFVRAGATPIFADCLPAHPNMDPESAKALITDRTKAVVIVHYAGVACDPEAFQALCRTHRLLLIEDAAHAIGADYKGKALGTFGDLAALSFHETKNITCGQGGLLVLNQTSFIPLAEQIWENGTNRAAFSRGETDRYTWVAAGGCFTSSDLNAAYLSGQLDRRTEIHLRRLSMWDRYHENLQVLEEKGLLRRPVIFPGCEHNGHIYYLILPDQERRDALLQYLRNHDVHAVFHYIPLHNSPFHPDGAPLPHCEKHARTLLRLPLFHSLSDAQIDKISASVRNFFS
jgi:dTDP-4-amino-4,6-dideoxygalactose transaminase